MSNKLAPQERYSYNNFKDMTTMFSYPHIMATAYNKIVFDFIDNTVSTIELVNNMILSFINSWKPVFQQSGDNSRIITDVWVDTAKIYQQNTSKMAELGRDTTKVVVDSTTALTNSNNKLVKSFFQKIKTNLPIIIPTATICAGIVAACYCGPAAIPLIAAGFTSLNTVGIKGEDALNIALSDRDNIKRP